MPSKTFLYFNNIFFSNGTNGSIRLENSAGNSIHDNMFSGISMNSSVSTTANLWNVAPIYSVGSSPQLNSVENFRLSSNSPGINVGDNNQQQRPSGSSRSKIKSCASACLAAAITCASLAALFP